jgi:hypothetical protein
VAWRSASRVVRQEQGVEQGVLTVGHARVEQVLRRCMKEQNGLKVWPGPVPCMQRIKEVISG